VRGGVSPTNFLLIHAELVGEACLKGTAHTPTPILHRLRRKGLTLRVGRLT